MTLAIIELDQGDSPILGEVLELLNRTQGQGLFSRGYLTAKVCSPEALVLAGFVENRLVCAGCAEIIKDFEYYRPFGSSICDRFDGRRVGSLCTLSVHEDYQGNGLGQKMTRKRMSWLEDQGCELIIGVSWVSGLTHTSNRVFQKLGFRAVNEVENFYREGAIENPFECPGCRIQPCACSAILYELKTKA